MLVEYYVSNVHVLLLHSSVSRELFWVNEAGKHIELLHSS